MQDILTSYSLSEKEKITLHIERLMPHLKKHQVYQVIGYIE